MPVLQSNILRLTHFVRMPSNDVAENVFHFQYLEAPTITDSEAVDDLETWSIGWATAWKAVASPGYEFERITVHRFDAVPTPGFVNIGSRNIGINGIALTDGLPPGSGGVLWRNVVGSRGTGKKFLIGMTEGQQDDGVWDATSLGLQVLVGLAWEASPDFYAGVTNDYQQGTFQGAYNVLKPFEPSGFISPIVGYQRRRKQGVGS